MTNHLTTQRSVEPRRTAAIDEARRQRLATSGLRGAATAATAVHEAGSAAFRAWADGLAHHVADHGLETVERDVADVCAAARRRGLPSTCVEIAADRSAPAVARERALGHVLTTLAAWSHTAAVATSDVA